MNRRQQPSPERERYYVAPVEDVTWLHVDGVRYQLPEIVLLHKARSARPKDERDLRTVWPALGPSARLWFTESLASLHPGHPWSDLVATLD